MPRPFLVARFVCFGKPFTSAAVPNLTESFSLSALLVNLNVLNLVFAAWNANVTRSAGLLGMLACFGAGLEN